MSITKKIAIIGTAFVVATTSVAAFAGDGRPGFGGFGLHGRIEKLLRDLKLSDPQEDLLVDMRANAKAKRKEMRQKMGSSMSTLADELKKRDPDKKKLHALLDQQADAMRAHAHERLDEMLRFHGTLSDEQRATLAERLDRLEKHRKKLAD
ncbi:MAG: Spy/CpxP family protein refolding chaperone [Deltaproteobacteria bacterium]|nr:Spy/CpxP family protein refolding chaperone [Deltaproteobacteria bacterium]